MLTDIIYEEIKDERVEVCLEKSIYNELEIPIQIATFGLQYYSGQLFS